MQNYRIFAYFCCIMKLNIKYSSFSIIITILMIVSFPILIFVYSRQGDMIIAYLFTALYAVLLASSLYYMPLNLTIDNRQIRLRRPFRSTIIPLDEIQSVGVYSPTMAERRIIGSGGWFGYWGRCSEPSLGKYFAYYGKASRTILLTLKDGRRYMLGCEDPSQTADYIAGGLDNEFLTIKI